MGYKCLSCGANIAEHDECCRYCGSNNPNYRPIDHDVNILLEKAKNAYENEQYAEAINLYKQAIALDPNVFDAYFFLAAGYTVIKRYEEGIKAMEKANELRPGLAPVHYNLGMLNKLNGRKDEARIHFEKALSLFKNEPSTNEQFLANIEKELNELGRKKRWKFF